MEKQLVYPAEIQSIPGIRADLEKLGRDWDIPRSELRQILIIIEELFSNSVRYAFRDNREHRIEFLLRREGMLFSIEIIDDGIPFNPSEYRPFLVSDPVDTGDGGMGLTLIRTFSDSINYTRKGDKNHLLIRKSLHGTSG